MKPREVIRRPLLRRDVEITNLERRIWADVQRLATIQRSGSTGECSQRFALFFRNLTANLRNQGALLPGDGKGGFIQPSKGN